MLGVICLESIPPNAHSPDLGQAEERPGKAKQQMQLMWLSGPTGEVKYISVTYRTVLAAGMALATFLLLLGFLLHFVGFKIAVEYNPDLARSIGGVTTEAEQQRMESIYRNNVDQLRAKLQTTVNEVRDLEAAKNRFLELATPPGLRDQLLKSMRNNNKGGPMVSLRPFASVFRMPLPNEFEQVQDDIDQTRRAVNDMQLQWEQQLNWLTSMPITLPVHEDHRVSSGFGIRTDPFTGGLAMHEGLDFVAVVGTPVVATAPGVVVRSERDSAYGNVVDVQHADGFLTRYAHLSARLVAKGDAVKRNQVLGKVGSTGRSTGPHLHYEVHRKDRPINPVLMIPRSRG